MRCIHLTNVQHIIIKKCFARDNLTPSVEQIFIMLYICKMETKHADVVSSFKFIYIITTDDHQRSPFQIVRFYSVLYRQ